ncbi:unnamed protein product [Effrenium voratum]|nr:unnamed protein product [Effrenium voratum]
MPPEVGSYTCAAVQCRCLPAPAPTSSSNHPAPFGTSARSLARMAPKARQVTWRLRPAACALALLGTAFAGICPRARVRCRAQDDAAGPVASVEDGSLEVIGDSNSRPVRLLYSPGVQRLLGLLSTLQSVSVPGGSACQAMLKNLPEVYNNVSEQEIPSDLEDDFEQALESMPELLPLEALEGGNVNVSVLMQEFVKLPLVRRLPELSERLVYFELLYPKSLAEQSGISQEELREALRGAAKELTAGELGSWSAQDFEEAQELLQRNPVLKEVSESVFYGQTTALAFGFVVAQFLFAALLIAACCSCGGGSDAPIPSDVNLLPLYTLDGTSK